MKNFCLIVNRSKDIDHAITNKITDYLMEHGANCYALDLPNTYEERKTHALELPEDIDCVITLGGDGTLIRAARSLLLRDIPIMGVNLGHLGFLAEIDKESLLSSLDRLLSDDYQIEDRMMIRGAIYKNGRQIDDDIALNACDRFRCLCGRRISDELSRGWYDRIHAYGFYGIQSVCGRPARGSDCTGRDHDADLCTCIERAMRDH